MNELIQKHASGIMVCLYIPGDIAEDIAVPGGEEPQEMHVTLAYIPKLGEDEEAFKAVCKVMYDTSTRYAPVLGQVGGIGVFNASDKSDGKDVYYATLNGAILPALVQDIRSSLDWAGIDIARDFGFIPHITLKYLDGTEGGLEQKSSKPFRIPSLSVASREFRFDIPFTGIRISKAVTTNPVEILKALSPEMDPVELLQQVIDENDGYIGGTIREGGSNGSFGSEYQDSGVSRSKMIPEERFAFGDMTFDVDAAKEMSQGKPNTEIDVHEDWSYKINVDGVAAMQSTSTNPVIVAQIPTESGIYPLLIDGHHRHYKARENGEKTLPAFMLTPEETLFIMDTHPDLMTKLTQNLRNTVDRPTDVKKNAELSMVQKVAAIWTEIIGKSQPTSSNVHVNAPMGAINYKRKKKQAAFPPKPTQDDGQGTPPPVAQPEIQEPGWQEPPENNSGVSYMDREKSFTKKMKKVVKAMDLDIAGALAEVSQKTDIQINDETAATWAARACAVFILAASEEDEDKANELIDWGDELYHEALEHASLVKDRGVTVGQVQDAVEEYRDKVAEETTEKSAEQLALTTLHEVSGDNSITIRKLNAMKQICYGVVLEPNTIDLQGDIMSKEEIEKTAHDYMENARNVGRRHQGVMDAVPVESYIAPSDIHISDGPYGPTTIKEGSWVIGIKVRDPDEWRKVENGEYAAFSVGGTGIRESV